MGAPTSREAGVEGSNLPGVAEAVRRVISARVRDPDTVDDLVQEALTRLLEARPRLDESAAVPYGIVTARNLVASLARSEQRRRRHFHRLMDPRVPDAPDEEVLRQEERRAVSAALTRLPPRDRQAVVAHELEGADTKALARELESTPGGVAARLARARARLRVEYLLALRNQDPPTERCRPVLLALSSGDRRRQAALAAGAHIFECAHCAALSEVVVGRRGRGLEGFVPLMLLGHFGGQVGRALRTPQAQAATVTVAVCAAAVALSGIPTDAPPPSPRRQAMIVTQSGRPVDLARPEALDRFAGRVVRGSDVPVQSVPADEGFWVGRGQDARLWVQLAAGDESAPEVRAGVRLRFRGRVVAHGPSFPSQVGVTKREGAALLRAQSVHVVVRERDLDIR